MSDSTGVTTYAYDLNGQIVGKTDPGSLVQAYSYDLAGQRQTLTDPDGGVRTYTYDAVGRTSELQMSNGKFTTYVYDARGQVGTVLYSSQQTVTSLYDSTGNMTERRAVNPSAASVYESFTYDLNGNPISERSVNSYVRTSTYDELDRIVYQEGAGLWNYPLSYSYDEVGNVNSNEQGPRVTHYNLAGEVTTMLFSGVLCTYTYDDNGNLVKTDGRLDGATSGSTTMTYDYENRQISQFVSTGSKATYTYSGDGLKRSEFRYESLSSRPKLTTLVWDGSDYLGEYEVTI